MLVIMALDRLFPHVAEESKVEVQAQPPPSPAAPSPSTSVAEPSCLRVTLGDKTYRVESKGQADGILALSVDGRVFKVQRSPSAPGELIIDGRPYRVEIKGIAGGIARVDVEGDTFEVGLKPETTPVAIAQPETPSKAEAPTPGQPILAPLPGKILRVTVNVGDRVRAEQEVCVIEAMKMENSIKAPTDGVVRQILVQPGQMVRPGETLLTI